MRWHTDQDQRDAALKSMKRERDIEMVVCRRSSKNKGQRETEKREREPPAIGNGERVI